MPDVVPCAAAGWAGVPDWRHHPPRVEYDGRRVVITPVHRPLACPEGPEHAGPG